MLPLVRIGPTKRILKPLTVQLQNNVPTLWAEVDENTVEEHGYDIWLLATGMIYTKEMLEGTTYVGTIQFGIDTVYHFYIKSVL